MWQRSKIDSHLLIQNRIAGMESVSNKQIIEVTKLIEVNNFVQQLTFSCPTSMNLKASGIFKSFRCDGVVGGASVDFLWRHMVEDISFGDGISTITELGICNLYCIAIII